MLLKTMLERLEKEDKEMSQTDLPPDLLPHWFELVELTGKPGGIATAAIRSCCLCGRMIDGMGGPGTGSVCVQCADHIKTGNYTLAPKTPTGRNKT